MSKRAREAEDSKKRKVARQRFRSMIRSVVVNRIWLVDAGDQKLSLNVKKNIAMLVRQQRKIGMLTLTEKGMIRTEHSSRTIEERKKLVTLLAGLTCFSRIPPKVRARLVPVIKFMVLGAGRKIIREGDMPLMVFFILTGEVEVTKKVFDHLKNEYVDKVEFIYGPGDCLGDVEMIENCKRKNTYTTTAEVELLVLFDENFNQILRPVMTSQWMDKKNSIYALNYFNFLSTEQVVVACKLGVLRQFEPLETIYFEDKGHVSYVHFVIGGECMILQCLKMKVRQSKGNKTFELVDISKHDADSMFQDLTNQELMKKLKEGEMHSKVVLDINEEIASNDDIQNERTTRKLFNKMDIKSFEIACGLRKPSVVLIAPQPQKQRTKFHEKISRSEGSEYADDMELGETEEYNYEDYDDTYYSEFELSVEEQQEEQEGESGDNQIKNTIETVDPLMVSSNGAENKEFRDSNNQISNSKDFGAIPNLNEQKTISVESSTKIEDHFIDVGSYTFGGIFGLGERLEHRVIMARTTVQCLMLPRFWLFEKEQNPGNVWQRRRFYLDSTVPSRQSLFIDFLRTRKWQKFKKDFIESKLDPNSTANSTKVEDIPIICRIVEAADD